MATLRDEIAAWGRALENPGQTPGSLRAAAEAVATALVEQLPTGRHPLVTTANVPIRLADRLDADVTQPTQLRPERPLVSGQLRDLQAHLVGQGQQRQEAVVPDARGDAGARSVRAPRPCCGVGGRPAQLVGRQGRACSGGRSAVPRLGAPPPAAASQAEWVPPGVGYGDPGIRGRSTLRRGSVHCPGGLPQHPPEPGNVGRWEWPPKCRRWKLGADASVRRTNGDEGPKRRTL